MDTSRIGLSIGLGLTCGLATMGLLSMIIIPISYTMNRFIYHGTGMRLMLGIIAAIFSPVFWPLMFGLWWFGRFKQAFYFGLIPALDELTASDEGTTWTGLLDIVYGAVTHPFRKVLYKEPYMEAIRSVFSLGNGVKTAPDALFEAAREAGAKKTEVEWIAAMSAIATEDSFKVPIEMLKTAAH